MINGTRPVTQGMIAPPPTQQMIAPPPVKPMIAPPPTTVPTGTRTQVESSRNATEALGQLTSPAVVESGHSSIESSSAPTVEAQHQATPFAETEFGQAVKSVGEQAESISKVIGAVGDIREGLSNRQDADKVSKAVEGVDTLISETPKVLSTAHSVVSSVASTVSSHTPQVVSDLASSAVSAVSESLPSLPSLPSGLVSAVSSVSSMAESASTTISAHTPQMVTDVVAAISPHASAEGMVTATVGFVQAPSLTTGANLVLVGLGGNDVSDAIKKTCTLCTAPSLENASEALKSAQAFVEKDGVKQLCTVASVVQNVGLAMAPESVSTLTGSTVSALSSYVPSLETISTYTAPVVSSISETVGAYVPTVVSDTASTLSGYLPSASNILPVASALVNTGLALSSARDLYNGTPDSSFKETLKKATSAVGSIADATGVSGGTGLGTLTATAVNLGIDVAAYSGGTVISASSTVLNAGLRAGGTLLSWGSSALSYVI